MKKTTAVGGMKKGVVSTKTTSFVSHRRGVPGVTARLPANVRGLGIGRVRGGVGSLPPWLRGYYGGRFIVDLGGGRVLCVGRTLDSCLIGLSDPLFAGCKLPVGPCVVSCVPGGGVGPIDPLPPNGVPEVPGDVPSNIPPDVPPDGTETPNVPEEGVGNNTANVNQVRFLKVSNQSNNDVKVFVQANNMKGPLEYNFKAGESNYLAVGKNQRLAADKVRVWAESKSKNWSANKNTPLNLNATPNKSNNVGTVNLVLK